MPIQEKDLLNARAAWGDSLIKISKTFETEGIEMATSVASDMIDKLYFFDFGEVLFNSFIRFDWAKSGSMPWFFKLSMIFWSIGY